MRFAAWYSSVGTALALVLATGCVMTRSGRDGDGTGTARSAEQAIVQAFNVFADQGPGSNGAPLTSSAKASPAGALADLEDHEDADDPREREIIAALIPLLEPLAEGKDTLSPADYRTLRDLMGRMAAARPDDFEIQYAMTTGMTAMEDALSATGGDGDAGRQSRAQALTARFPNQARAHHHLGRVMAAAGDEAAALRSYGRCLKLDPGMLNCKNDLRQTAASFQRPRCTSIAAKRLAFHQAYATNADTAKAEGKKRKRLRPVTLDKRQLLMEPRAALDGKAVEEAESVGNDVRLTLTPPAAAKLADITAQLAERQAFLAVVVDGKLKAAPQVMSPIESGTLTVGGLSLEQLCTKLERRPLPDGIAPLL